MSNVSSAQREAILKALKERRTVGRVKKDEVPKALIEQLIDAASYAPSHYNTQPWKFIVMTGEGRSLLGEGYAKVHQATTGESDAEKLEKEAKKAFRAPVVIAAICSPSEDPRAIMEEELAATHAAVQNLLLAAHALELGAIWRSGAPIYHPVMHEHFQLSDKEKLVGLVYVGYPELVPAVPTRRSVADVTTWVEA